MATAKRLGENPAGFFYYDIKTTYGEKCLATSMKSTIEEDLDSVVGWPENGKDDIQVGRLTYSSGSDDLCQILDSKLKELLGISKNDDYNDIKRHIADTDAQFTCDLGRLNNVRISTKYRGKGIAKNLVKHMQSILHDCIIFLHIDSDTREAAKSLYKSTGFKHFKGNPDYMVYIPKSKEQNYKSLQEKLR